MAKVKKQSVKRKTSTTKRKVSTKKSGRGSSLLSKVEDINFDYEGLKICLYGRSGTGKTTFWGTFPKPILVLVCSGSVKSGELRSVANISGISQYRITDTTEIPTLCQELQESNEYKTVVLDHATYLSDLCVKETAELDEIPVQKSWGMVTQQDWGQIANKLKEYFRSLLNLDSNVVIVSQEREFNVDQDSDLLLPYVGAALPPSVAGWLNPACDYIVQTFIRDKMVEKISKVGKKTTKRLVKGKGKEYCLRTGPDSVYTTKFRVPKGHELPDVLVDPDYDKLMRIINGK